MLYAYLQALTYIDGQVSQPTGVAELIVVPAQDFDHTTIYHTGKGCIYY
jgi:hypothetical protein